MKTRLIILTVLGLFICSACGKREEKNLKYIATDATSAYKISYRNQAGELITETIFANSKEDEWIYSYIATQGDIVYVSGSYKDITSSLKIMILVDGTVYKQGSSIGDTINYVTVSGVVPY